MRSKHFYFFLQTNSVSLLYCCIIISITHYRIHWLKKWNGIIKIWTPTKILGLRPLHCCYQDDLMLLDYCFIAEMASVGESKLYLNEETLEGKYKASPKCTLSKWYKTKMIKRSKALPKIRRLTWKTKRTR